MPKVQDNLSLSLENYEFAKVLTYRNNAFAAASANGVSAGGAKATRGAAGRGARFLVPKVSTHAN